MASSFEVVFKEENILLSFSLSFHPFHLAGLTQWCYGKTFFVGMHLKNELFIKIDVLLVQQGTFKSTLIREGGS